MQIKILLLLFLYLLVTVDSPAQITFQESFSTASNGMPQVRQTNDGGYLITGDLLIKTNANGDTLWTRNFNFGTANASQQTFDGGYAISGYTYVDGAGSSDFYLTKTDSSGNITWSKTYGGESYDEGYSMEQTSDSGFIIAGNTWSFGSGAWDIYLVKTDADGTMVWAKAIGGGSEEKAATVQQTSDGGFIVAGYTTSFGSVGPDAFVTKTDGNGNIVWSKTYNGPGGEFITCIRQVADGGYIFTGHAVNFTTTVQDLFLAKTNDEGTVLWSRFFTNGYNFGNSVEQTTDGGYIITATSSQSSVNGNDVCLIKTNSNGDTLWTAKFGSTGNDEGMSVSQTSDGGYVVAGRTTSFGTGFYLIKTDAMGNAGCNQEILSVIPNDSLLSELSVVPTVFADGTTSSFTALAGSGTTVSSLCFSTAVSEIIQANDFLIFPNPVHGSFRIRMNNIITKGILQVLNATGSIILEEEFFNPGVTVQLPGNISPGIYLLKISGERKILVGKLVVEGN